jgi:hypothetical protein
MRAATVSSPLVTLTNVWKFDQTGADLGSAWKEKDYDDTGWDSGPGLLALETSPVITSLTNTVLALSNGEQRVITFYFRTHFHFPTNPAGFSLFFTSYLDDGGVFYLNGKEIQRVRMAALPAAITYTSLAALPPGGDATAPDNFIVTGGLATNLIAGDNVLAVEVHQAGTNSSDVVFGAAALVETDTSFRWAVQAGGSGDDSGRNVAVDATGNIFMYGSFTGTTCRFGSAILTNAGARNSFLAKYNPSGELLWVVHERTTGSAFANGMTLDTSGNVYVTQPFSGRLTIGGTNLTDSGQNDGVVAKYDNSGNVLWVSQISGTGFQPTSRIAVDAAGNAYVVGIIIGNGNFAGTTITNFAPAYDYFVAKYSGANGSVLWVRRAGGSTVGVAGQQSTGVAADAAGNSYVTAVMHGAVKFGETNIINVSGTNFYLAKHDPDGNLLWVREVTGGVLDGAGGFNERGCAVDPAGNVYAVSNFKGVASFGSIALTNTGGFDVFVAKYDPNGNLLWARQANGTGNDANRNIAVDSDGNAYVAGLFSGTTLFGNTTLTARSGTDVFVAKYDADGNLLWVKQAGGSGGDNGIGVAADGCGNTYVAGTFSSSAVFGNINLTTSGGTDLFVTRIDDPVPALSISRLGNQALVSWPNWSKCFQLETTTNLSAENSWNTVVLAPVRAEGRNLVTNDLSDASRFFRLKKP